MPTRVTPDVPPTEREIAVLKLICEGRSTKEIARQLGISFKTVASHRYRLMAKANARNSVLLFRWALLNGYVTVESESVCNSAAVALRRVMGSIGILAVALGFATE